MRPEYIPIPYSIAISRHQELIGYYVCLRALSWRYDFTHTEALPAGQLQTIIGVKRSQFYNVINKLEELGWITRNVPYPGGLQIWFVVQDIGQSDLSDESVKLNIDSINNLTTTPINRTVRLIGLLQEKGIHLAIAEHLVRTLQHPRIYRAIEVYEWARKTKRAKSPGYLVKYLQDNWEEPDGFIPPGWRCPNCGQRKDGHAPECKKALSLWEDEGRVNLEEICPTCGQKEHRPDCWRLSTGENIPVLSS